MNDYSIQAYGACRRGNADGQQQQSAAAQIVLLNAECAKLTEESSRLGEWNDKLTLQRDEACEQFDTHVAWASEQIATIERQVDALGEALYLMSGPLKASGFLDNGHNHRLYENVVEAFREIGWKDDHLEAEIARLNGGAS